MQDDKFWFSRNLRAKESKRAKAIERTAWQMLNEIFSFAKMKAITSIDKIQEMYRLKASDMDDDQKSANYFKEAHRVWLGAQSSSVMKSVISELDNTYGIMSPLNSVTKMYGMVIRAKNRTHRMGVQCTEASARKEQNSD